MSPDDFVVYMELYRQETGSKLFLGRDDIFSLHKMFPKAVFVRGWAKQVFPGWTLLFYRCGSKVQ